MAIAFRYLPLIGLTLIMAGLGMFAVDAPWTQALANIFHWFALIVSLLLLVVLFLNFKLPKLSERHGIGIAMLLSAALGLFIMCMIGKEIYEFPAFDRAQSAFQAALLLAIFTSLARTDMPESTKV